jgi:hypothetical protein
MKHTGIQSIISLCVISVAVMLFSCKPPAQQVGPQQELNIMKAAIEKQLQNESRRISDQLAAFSRVAAADRDFSMKLFVEGNRSAPEVTDLTYRFMEPMGFSLLEIADSGLSLLSCAQFPASTGTKIASTASMLDEKALFVIDNVKGQKTLTLQAKISFKILDSLFYCIGGRIVDDAFIAQLCSGSGFRLVLKQGDKILGMSNSQSISDIKDSTVALNGTVYPAVSIPLPVAGQGEAPVLILINEKTVIQKS